MSVLVLMYHGVGRQPGPLFFERRAFAAHADVIAESGLPVLTAGEVGERLRAGDLPDRAVALTFDDGFASVVDEAVPILSERRLCATVFCVAGKLGATNEWATGRRGTPVVPLAPARDLVRIAEAGFEIGAHGMFHAPLDTDDENVIRTETAGARRTLEAAIGRPVRTFAYPYGARPTAAAERAVRAVFTSAWTTVAGRVGAGADPAALPRLDAHYVRSPRLLRAVLMGRAEAYVALRRRGAAVRRWFSRDYVPAAAGSTK